MMNMELFFKIIQYFTYDGMEFNNFQFFTKLFNCKYLSSGYFLCANYRDLPKYLKYCNGSLEIIYETLDIM